jgi:4-diphosphocytidyl-2-C-methyl-D-erythritol kinase
MSDQIVSLIAPAKLTLSLRVTGIRPDGFHLIDAEMVTLELADELRVDTSRTGLAITGKFAEDLDALENDVPSAQNTAFNGDDNLVVRALRLANRQAHVAITKNIPSGGGLGGGSADAAAILRWAGFTDLVSAAKLGADIAFCMVGGRARVSGIGEVVNPLKKVAREITLVVPPFRVSTPAVYRAFDELTDFCKMPLKHAGVNDLEPAAIKVEPRLAIWKEKITQACGFEPTLAGSGSTWWLDGNFANLASQLPDATVITTHTN